MLGLPANVANATNRVGVTIQNVVGITTFQRKGRLNLEGGLWYTLVALPGAVMGAWVASSLGKQQMDYAIGIVMVIMLFVVLLNPQQWLREKSDVAEGRPSIWMLIVFFGIGIYGGFIQAGVGVFILTALVMGVGYNLAHANAIKLMIVLAITLVVLVVFVYQDLGSVVHRPAHGGGPEHRRVDGGHLRRLSEERQPLGAPATDRRDRLFDLQVLRHHRPCPGLDRLSGFVTPVVVTSHPICIKANTIRGNRLPRVVRTFMSNPLVRDSSGGYVSMAAAFSCRFRRRRTTIVRISHHSSARRNQRQKQDRKQENHDPDG